MDNKKQINAVVKLAGWPNRRRLPRTTVRTTGVGAQVPRVWSLLLPPDIPRR
jgi:hypothetical protein